MHIYITKLCQENHGKIQVHNELEVSVSPLNGMVTHDPLNEFCYGVIPQYLQLVCSVQQ